MTRSRKPDRAFRAPTGVEEAHNRIADCDVEIERICRQLAGARRLVDADWAHRARSARSCFQKEETQLYKWISERHLDMLRECAAVIETLDDLSPDEADLLDRLDEALKNR